MASKPRISTPLPPPLHRQSVTFKLCFARSRSVMTRPTISPHACSSRPTAKHRHRDTTRAIRSARSALSALSSVEIFAVKLPSDSSADEAISEARRNGTSQWSVAMERRSSCSGADGVRKSFVRSGLAPCLSRAIRRLEACTHLPHRLRRRRESTTSIQRSPIVFPGGERSVGQKCKWTPWARTDRWDVLSFRVVAVGSASVRRARAGVPTY